MTVTSNTDESMRRRDRWRSDEDYLTSGVPGQPAMRMFDPDECCGTSGCSCGSRRVVSVTLGDREVKLPDDWGPVAAEAAVEAGWDREAAARGGAGTLHREVLAAALTPEPEQDVPCCADEGQPEPPWGVLPSEKQMAAQRDADYGHPGPNFTTTAAMWSEYINAKYGTSLRLDTDDVPAMNVLQKVCRQARRPKRDNWDDIAGYADTAVMAQS